MSHLRRLSSLAFALFVATGTIACVKKSVVSTVREESAVDKAFRGVGSYPIWEYDGGPNPFEPVGKQLIDLHAGIPYFPGLSEAIYGDQMFRPTFGPVIWRMMQKPNSVKILFIGQDATHIAEAAGRPATAGFGGRAQDMAKYFGVSSGGAFINTYAFTIRWQYGAADTPVISYGSDGKPRLSFSSVTGTPVWLLSQDINSPIVKWRNSLIEWIIRNNKDSLKLVVLFGGAARDAAGSFIEANGGHVGTRQSLQKILDSKTVIPEFDLKYGGGNKQASTIFTKEGGDLLLEFAKEQGIPFNENTYSQSDESGDNQALDNLRSQFITAFNKNPEKWMARMALPPGSSSTANTQDPNNALKGTGLVHPAQLGGYDVDRQIQIGSSPAGTLSLKGLKFSDGFTITNDIVVAQFPHPTSLSMTAQSQGNEAASALVNNKIENLRKQFPPQVWNIEADKNVIDPDDGSPLINRYAAGKPYRYGRGDMGTEYYDFGAPNSRMVNVSSAVRENPDVIVFGTRESDAFKAIDAQGNFLRDEKNRKLTDPRLDAMQRSLPSSWPSDNEMWILRGTQTDGSTQPSVSNRRYTFDAGPGAEMAQLMKRNLPRDAKFTALERDGSSVNGDFGHYRGTFKNPQVVILADPDGDDDLITARALTGSRGQYLNGLMSNLGVGDQYLIIKTAPYSNYSDENPNSQNSKNWLAAIEATKQYREAVLKKIFETSHPKMILTDGEWAQKEFARIFPSAPNSIPVFAIQRSGTANSSGLAEVAKNIAAAGIFGAGQAAQQSPVEPKMIDIPRSHLTYYARVWEGTSGDRVVTSNNPKYRSKAWAEVAPSWASRQKYRMSEADIAGCKTLIEKAIQFGVRMGQDPKKRAESVPQYLKRRNGQAAAPSADALCRSASGSSMVIEDDNFEILAAEDLPVPL